jgi:hypothetical protein
MNKQKQIKLLLIENVKRIEEDAMAKMAWLGTTLKKGKRLLATKSGLMQHSGKFALRRRNEYRRTEECS